MTKGLLLVGNEIVRGASAADISDYARLHALEQLIDLFGGYYSKTVQKLLRFESVLDLTNVINFIALDPYKSLYVQSTLAAGTSLADLNSLESLNREYRMYRGLIGRPFRLTEDLHKNTAERFNIHARKQINLKDNKPHTYAAIDQLINEKIHESEQHLMSPKRPLRAPTEVALIALQRLKQALLEGKNNPSMTPAQILKDFADGTIYPAGKEIERQEQQQPSQQQQQQAQQQNQSGSDKRRAAEIKRAQEELHQPSPKPMRVGDSLAEDISESGDSLSRKITLLTDIFKLARPEVGILALHELAVQLRSQEAVLELKSPAGNEVRKMMAEYLNNGQILALWQQGAVDIHQLMLIFDSMELSDLATNTLLAQAAAQPAFTLQLCQKLLAIEEESWHILHVSRNTRLKSWQQLVETQPDNFEDVALQVLKLHDSEFVKDVIDYGVRTKQNYIAIFEKRWTTTEQSAPEQESICQLLILDNLKHLVDDIASIRWTSETSLQQRKAMLTSRLRQHAHYLNLPSTFIVNFFKDAIVAGRPTGLYQQGKGELLTNENLITSENGPSVELINAMLHEFVHLEQDKLIVHYIIDKISTELEIPITNTIDDSVRHVLVEHYKSAIGSSSLANNFLNEVLAIRHAREESKNLSPAEKLRAEKLIQSIQDRQNDIEDRIKRLTLIKTLEEVSLQLENESVQLKDILPQAASYQEAAQELFGIQKLPESLEIILSELQELESGLNRLKELATTKTIREGLEQEIVDLIHEQGTLARALLTDQARIRLKEIRAVERNIYRRRFLEEEPHEAAARARFFARLTQLRQETTAVIQDSPNTNTLDQSPQQSGLRQFRQRKTEQKQSMSVSPNDGEQDIKPLTRVRNQPANLSQASILSLNNNDLRLYVENQSTKSLSDLFATSLNILQRGHARKETKPEFTLNEAEIFNNIYLPRCVETLEIFGKALGGTFTYRLEFVGYGSSFMRKDRLSTKLSEIVKHVSPDRLKNLWGLQKKVAEQLGVSINVTTGKVTNNTAGLAALTNHLARAGCRIHLEFTPAVIDSDKNIDIADSQHPSILTIHLQGLEKIKSYTIDELENFIVKSVDILITQKDFNEFDRILRPSDGNTTEQQEFYRDVKCKILATLISQNLELTQIAKQKLLDECKELISVQSRKRAGSYKNLISDFESEGRLGLLHALINFDLRKLLTSNVPFDAFAGTAIKNHLIDVSSSLRQQIRSKRIGQNDPMVDPLFTNILQSELDRTKGHPDPATVIHLYTDALKANNRPPIGKVKIQTLHGRIAGLTRQQISPDAEGYVSLANLVLDPTDPLERIDQTDEIEHILKVAKRTLTSREFLAIKLRHRLDKHEDQPNQATVESNTEASLMPFAEMAKLLNTTPVLAQRLVWRATNKLRARLTIIETHKQSMNSAPRAQALALYEAMATPENELNQGSQHITYRIPGTDNLILRVSLMFWGPDGGLQQSDKLAPLADPFPEYNFGQAVAKIGEHITIIKKQNDPVLDSLFENDPAGTLKRLAAMPPQSYEDLARKLTIINSKGYYFDGAHPGNLCLGEKDFNIFDLDTKPLPRPYAKELISEPDNNSLSSMLAPLLNYRFYANTYESSSLEIKSELRADYSQVVRKCVNACQIVGLSIGLEKFVAHVLERAGMKEELENLYRDPAVMAAIGGVQIAAAALHNPDRLTRLTPAALKIAINTDERFAVVAYNMNLSQFNSQQLQAFATRERTENLPAELAYKQQSGSKIPPRIVKMDTHLGIELAREDRHSRPAPTIDHYIETSKAKMDGEVVKPSILSTEIARHLLSPEVISVIKGQFISLFTELEMMRRVNANERVGQEERWAQKLKNIILDQLQNKLENNKRRQQIIVAVTERLHLVIDSISQDMAPFVIEHIYDLDKEGRQIYVEWDGTQYAPFVPESASPLFDEEGNENTKANAEDVHTTCILSNANICQFMKSFTTVQEIDKNIETENIKGNEDSTDDSDATDRKYRDPIAVIISLVIEKSLSTKLSDQETKAIEDEVNQITITQTKPTLISAVNDRPSKQSRHRSSEKRIPGSQKKVYGSTEIAKFLNIGEETLSRSQWFSRQGQGRKLLITEEELFNVLYDNEAADLVRYIVDCQYYWKNRQPLPMMSYTPGQMLNIFNVTHWKILELRYKQGLSVFSTPKGQKRATQPSLIHAILTNRIFTAEQKYDALKRMAILPNNQFDMLEDSKQLPVWKKDESVILVAGNFLSLDTQVRQILTHRQNSCKVRGIKNLEGINDAAFFAKTYAAQRNGSRTAEEGVLVIFQAKDIGGNRITTPKTEQELNALRPICAFQVVLPADADETPIEQTDRPELIQRDIQRMSRTGRDNNNELKSLTQITKKSTGKQQTELLDGGFKSVYRVKMAVRRLNKVDLHSVAFDEARSLFIKVTEQLFNSSQINRSSFDQIISDNFLPSRSNRENFSQALIGLATELENRDWPLSSLEIKELSALVSKELEKSKLFAANKEIPDSKPVKPDLIIPDSEPDLKLLYDCSPKAATARWLFKSTKIATIAKLIYGKTNKGASDDTRRILMRIEKLLRSSRWQELRPCLQALPQLVAEKGEQGYAIKEAYLRQNGIGDNCWQPQAQKRIAEEMKTTPEQVKTWLGEAHAWFEARGIDRLPKKPAAWVKKLTDSQTRFIIDTDQLTIYFPPPSSKFYNVINSAKKLTLDLATFDRASHDLDDNEKETIRRRCKSPGHAAESFPEIAKALRIATPNIARFSSRSLNVLQKYEPLETHVRIGSPAQLTDIMKLARAEATVSEAQAVNQARKKAGSKEQSVHDARTFIEKRVPVYIKTFDNLGKAFGGTFKLELKTRDISSPSAKSDLTDQLREIREKQVHPPLSERQLADELGVSDLHKIIRHPVRGLSALSLVLEQMGKRLELSFKPVQEIDNQRLESASQHDVHKKNS